MTTSVVSPLQPLCSPSHGMWPRPNGGGGPRPSSQSVAKSAGFGVRRGKSASVEYSALCLTTTRRQGSMGLGAQTALWLASPRLASPRLASLCLARHRRPCPCWAVQRPVQRGRTVQHRWQEAKKDAERYAWLCECVTIGGLYFISDDAAFRGASWASPLRRELRCSRFANPCPLVSAPPVPVDGSPRRRERLPVCAAPRGA